jgi:hypothetical protein
LEYVNEAGKTVPERKLKEIWNAFNFPLLFEDILVGALSWTFWQ